MTDTLTITQSDNGPVRILHLSGRLDGETQGKLMEVARAKQAAGTRYLLVDLTDVAFVSSAGLGALHLVYKMFTPAQAVASWDKGDHGEPYKSEYMKLAGASPSVYYVLNIAGFLQNIPIYPDLDQALKSFPTS